MTGTGGGVGPRRAGTSAIASAEQLDVDPVAEFGKRGAVGGQDVHAVGQDVEDGVVGVDPADAGEAGQRVGALLHQLRLALLGEQRHHHVDVLGAGRQVHGAADGGDVVRLARVPVGQVAVGGDLVGAEHADVEVSAAHHREGVGVVEVGRARQLGHRDLARVGQVRVDVVAVLGGAHAEHAVLCVQD